MRKMAALLRLGGGRYASAACGRRKCRSEHDRSVESSPYNRTDRTGRVAEAIERSTRACGSQSKRSKSTGSTDRGETMAPQAVLQDPVDRRDLAGIGRRHRAVVKLPPALIDVEATVLVSIGRRPLEHRRTSRTVGNSGDNFARSFAGQRVSPASPRREAVHAVTGATCYRMLSCLKSSDQRRNRAGIPHGINNCRDGGSVGLHEVESAST